MIRSDAGLEAENALPKTADGNVGITDIDDKQHRKLPENAIWRVSGSVSERQDFRAEERGTHDAGNNRGNHHFHNGVDAHESADENDNIPAGDQALYIFRAAKEQDKRGHEKQGIEKCRTEARDEAGRPVAQLFRTAAENQPDQKAVQSAGNETLNKSEEGIDVEQGGAHAAGNADADALQKAQYAEHAAHRQAAQRAERDGRDGHGDDVEGDHERSHRDASDRREGEDDEKRGHKAKDRQGTVVKLFVHSKLPPAAAPPAADVVQLISSGQPETGPCRCGSACAGCRAAAIFRCQPCAIIARSADKYKNNRCRFRAVSRMESRPSASNKRTCYHPFLIR